MRERIPEPVDYNDLLFALKPSLERQQPLGQPPRNEPAAQLTEA